MRGEVSGPDALQYPILCDDLKKVYPGATATPPRRPSGACPSAVAKGECFGMLGPNGAGKSTSISMVRHPTPRPSLYTITGRTPLVLCT